MMAQTFKLSFCDRLKVYRFVMDMGDGKGPREILCDAYRMSELVDSFPEGSPSRIKVDDLVSRARVAPHREVSMG